MKMIELTKDSKGARLYRFIVNREELEIMQALVSNCLLWTPRIFTTTIERGRLKNMANLFTSAKIGKRVKFRPPPNRSMIAKLNEK